MLDLLSATQNIGVWTKSNWTKGIGPKMTRTKSNWTKSIGSKKRLGQKVTGQKLLHKKVFYVLFETNMEHIY